MRKKLKTKMRVVALTGIIMSTTLSTSVYAVDNYYYKKLKNYEITSVDDSSIVVNSGNITEKITVIENNNMRKITIYNTNTGGENYLIFNKADNSIYSSITDKTTFIEEQDSNITTYADRHYSTVFISYAEFKNSIGNTATVGGVLGLILAKVPGAQAAGGVIGTISTLVGGGSLFIPNDSKHGLKFGIETVKRYRYRLGKRHVYRIDKYITSVSRY
ncbi:hypothetical protein [Peptostreptococcus sp. D1]|uniref:hypothetical protein n=1 Tax=Peptostreptococcus sp. D1 TaxID=72304 RepID=UPI0008EEAEAB|nr:hypothetical protein [Peptostreptococcus sp. D1]SFE27723.1 hypothetical protein SAMN02910278_00504 [Peptostreptococcus sp. D1]